MNLKEWIFTTDHKRVGVLYLIGSIAAFIVAGVMALLMRIELSQAGETIMNAERFNMVMSMHGILMVAVAVAATLGSLGNYLVPIMIGGRHWGCVRVGCPAEAMLA